jgi:DNA repair exonuclease SbcCD nuclease subunit
MSTTFLHTADWQIGKPFAGVEDVQKRALLQQERITVLKRVAAVARERRAEFVIVAGDLFDSPSVTKATVSAACSAMGALRIPIFAIPGNHDHGGPGSLWEQPFFRQEQAQLAPNLRVLLTPEPVELENAVLFPCPLLRRHESVDLTAWLRKAPDESSRFGHKARIVVAHGSVLGFSSIADDDDGASSLTNQIDLTRIPDAEYDYIALGDWHGMKQVGTKAWYAGTPEFDRFPKGSDHAPGHILAVTVQRGANPKVDPVSTVRIGWHVVSELLADDAALGQLEQRMESLIGNRAHQDLVRLELDGSLGIAAMTRLEERLEAWRARLLRLRLENRAVVAPAAEELDALTLRAGDPLISRVAQKLIGQSAREGEEGAIARVALRELHAACSGR